MDERVRKRRSLWDAEDENQSISWSGKEHHSTYDGRCNRRFSASKADNSSLMSKDQAGWSSLEPSEEKDIITHKGENIYKDGHDKLELRKRSDNKYSYKSISSGFDRCDQRKHSNSPDDGLSQPRRHLEGGRNRSRDRGRSRSQSPSWNRGRDRSGMRMRSRSRSRSRNRNTARTRSRSPFHERRRESHGWNDRSDSGMSSQTCRDFVAGNCRRGSLCRFLHSDNMDGDSLVNDHAERWRSKPDHGHAMTYSEGPGRQFWNKVSGLDYGEDDSSRSKGKGTICCKDFMRGKCKWGSSCKFSHHVGSGDNNGKVTRNASFDRDHEFQHGEIRTLCKYFLAGKCNRDNCWFSHDRLTTNNHESRRHDDDGHNSLAEKNRWWNGPKWDQEEPESNVAKGTGWGENVTNENIDDTIPIERRHSRWVHGSRTGASPEWKEAASENNNYHSTDGGGDIVAVKPMIVEDSNDIKEYPVISQGLESQNLGVVSTGSHGSKTPEGSSLHLSEATMHAGVTVKSDIQQHPGVLEGNLASALSFDGLGEPKDNRNTMNTVFPPGQSLNQNVVEDLGLNHPFVSSDQKDNSFFPHPSSARNFDLNGPGKVLGSSLNLQNQIQSHKKEGAKTPEMPPEFGAPQSFYNNASNGQAAQVLFTPAAASSMQKFVHEQAEAHPETALNSFTSTGVVSSLEATLHVQLNPNVRSPDHLDPLGNGRDKGGYDNQISGEFPYSFEQKSQMLFEEFSPMSGGNPEFESALPSVSSKVQNLESPKLKQQETPSVLEVKDNNINSGIEDDKEQEKNHKESGDGHGKAENGTGNKDDKDMRLFKNALVEFVKDILKPKWKEGRMSREVHKTIVKKAVDKVTSTIQGDHIPKTQDKIDQYLSHSRTKISKLVLAYVERHLKADT